MNPVHAIRRLGGHPCVASQRPGWHVPARPAAVASASPGRARLLPWACPPLPPGWRKRPPPPGLARVHAALPSGMPAWHIIFIPTSAALVAAARAVTVYWTRAARDHNRHLKHVPGGHTPHAN